MKTPKFWHKITIISLILWPFSYLYKLASILRNLIITPIKVDKPIICIGNLTSGGAGKTPIAIAIGKILKSIDIQFAYLGHGYKAQIESLILVDKDKHMNCQVGDEAILLSEISHTFISKNRVFAAKQIAKMPDEQLIIMDDGLQNPSLIKDLSILVIDGEYGFGNNLIIPAGPLRQNIKVGSKNVNLIIIVGKDKFNYAKKFKGTKVILVQAKVINKDISVSEPLIAFCGIGRPSKFFDILKKHGYNVIKEVSFGDHYQYKERDLNKLINLANKKGATLITTKKDFVRLDKKYQEQVKYLDIEIEFKKADRMYIENKLKKLLK